MPDYSIIQKLCEAIHVTLPELMDGEDAADSRDDGEYLTRLEWYVRVFARKESEQWALCGGVEEAMARLGYRRTFHWEEGMADVRHTAYRFEKTI